MQFAFRWMNCLLMREISVKNTIRMWDTYLVSAIQGLVALIRLISILFRLRVLMHSLNSICTCALLFSWNGARNCRRWTSRYAGNTLRKTSPPMTCRVSSCSFNPYQLKIGTITRSSYCSVTLSYLIQHGRMPRATSGSFDTWERSLLFLSLTTFSTQD